MTEKRYYVYILTNVGNTVLYTGVTNNIGRRLNEHRTAAVDSFTKKYNVTKLVHVEIFGTPYDAIAREKQIKGGSRAKKVALIINENPEWKDLAAMP
jgi:putative endonuclease